MPCSASARAFQRAVARFAGAALLLGAAVGRAGADENVDWRDAHRCVGRICAVRGTVVEARDEGAVIRLYFDAERRDVYVTLVRGWLVTWPDYAGHAIVATGPVDRFRDQTEVMVRDPSAITVLDAALTATPAATTTPVAASPTPTAAATSPVPTAVPPTAVPPTVAPPPADDEVERLRRRVRELEERVEELEGTP